MTAYTLDYNGAAGDGWLYNMLSGASDGSGSLPRDVATYVQLDFPASVVPNDPSNIFSF